MDIASREKLMTTNLEPIAAKLNIWNQLALDIQLDVFQCLRAYDLFKNGRFASRQWFNVLECHKEMLPKFRYRQDWRAPNRLVGDNSDQARLQRNELVRRNVEYNIRIQRKVERINNKYMLAYLVLSILSCISALMAQFGDMSVERLTATSLLLAVTLRMGNTYEKFIRYRVSCSRDFYGGRLIIFGYSYYSYEKVMFLKYVWPAYLAGRSLIFGSIAILTCFKAIPAITHIFDILLVLLHLPELASTTHQSYVECMYWFDHHDTLKRKIGMLRPEFKGRFERQFKNWYNEAPVHVNLIAWILVASLFNTQLFSLFVFGFVAAGIMAQMQGQDQGMHGQGQMQPPQCSPACSEPQKCGPNNQCFTPVQCNPACSGELHCNPMNGTCMSPPPGMHMGGQHQ